MSAITKKSILARLLARENIQVEQTNHTTAFFDVERRILGLPYWKDVSKDLYDLFVSHEVGHALHTPAEGWHSSTKEIPGIPRGYVNVIEDVRIEKLILREFPGLLGAYMRGYKELIERDFFGDINDIDTYSFVDRLNIFAKSRGLVNVKFTAIEQIYVDEVMAVETWDDVIAACKSVYAFMKKDIPVNIFTQVLDDLGVKAEPAVKMEITDEMKKAVLDGKFDHLRVKEVEPDEDASTATPSLDEESDDEEGEKEREAGGGAGTLCDSGQIFEPTETSDVDKIEIDTFYRKKLDSMANDYSNKGTMYVKAPSYEHAMASVSTFEQVASKRRKNSASSDYPEKEYIKFLKVVKDPVNSMVKEFEMRKAARRLARGKVSDKGSINVNALYRYKYDDHIFKQVTSFDDDTSHGMVMLIDYSGSMDGIIKRVIRQVLIMTTFCKRIGVPFEVYGFTNPNSVTDWGVRHDNAVSPLATVDLSATHVFKLIDSSMKKPVYTEAYKTLFAQSVAGKNAGWFGQYESMQGTPLNGALMVMYHVIDAFRKKHGIQKMNLIMLTDGAGDGMSLRGGIDVPRNKIRDNVTMEILGQTIKLGSHKNTVTLLDGIRKMGVKTINYHFVSATNLQYHANLNLMKEEERKKEIAKMLKSGVYIQDNTDGYDRQILTDISTAKAKSRFAGGFTQIPLEDEEFDDFIDEQVDSFADKFTNTAVIKKRDRLIAAKFAEIIS